MYDYTMLTCTPGLNYRKSTPPGGWLNPDCPDKFEYGKFMLPIDTLVYTEKWDVRRFHIWYMHACNTGLREIIVKLPKELLRTDEDYPFPISFDDMHLLLRRTNLDIYHITLCAM
jgi:hypothetical protein